MSPHTPPFPELAAYLAAFDRRCVAAGWWAPRFHLRVVADIFADLARWLRARAGYATAAEREDRAAIELLRRAIADGHLDDVDLPRVRAAIRHVERSAALDARLAATLSP